ncbi:MAG: M23 family metallopeptidase [Rikenellaceae bacterium]
MKKIILHFFTLLAPILASAQEYANPLDIDLILSSNFGEIRENHFHSGLDFKTGNVEGKNVYSIESGYISRIYVSPTGYGNALYIYHPTKGSTSVYGHLRNFTPEIEAYVRKYQYRNKRFFADLYPDKTAFPVEKGELVAYSGNSGSSGGPHLHFEIRNANNEPVSILRNTAFMAKNAARMVKDEICPTIHSVSLVRVDTVRGVPIHTTYKKVNATKVGNTYKLANDTLGIQAASYFVIEVSERKTGTSNIFGIYSMDVLRSGNPFFSFKLDKVSFGNTRYINTFCKFPETSENRNDKIRTYISPNNKLHIYGKVENRGVVKPQSINDVETISVEISDDDNNKATLEFSIKADIKENSVTLSDAGLPIWWKNGASTKVGDLKIEVPALALYESELLDIVEQPKSTKTVSNIYIAGNKDTKLQKSITLTFDIDSISSVDRSKLTIVSIDSKGKFSSKGGSVSGNKIIAKVSNFGTYALALDSTAPTVTPKYNTAETQSGKTYLSFKIDDELSGIKTYSATINDKWALLEYDPKTKSVMHPLADGIAQKGNNTIQVTITDSVGNIGTYKGTFIY